MLTGTALDEFEDLQLKLKCRRLGCVEPEASDWTLVYTRNYKESLQKVDKVTTGRFMCGANFVSFEDEIDAVAFTLVN